MRHLKRVINNPEIRGSLLLGIGVAVLYAILQLIAWGLKISPYAALSLGFVAGIVLTLIGSWLDG